MSKKIYIGTIIISILILIPACICENVVFTIFSNIGCSGIAAAIMAIFLDNAAQKKENERKIKARAIYFKELKEQLKMMLERILWFDQRMDDNFDWNKEPSVYSSLQYMLFTSRQYPSEEKISFQEAESRLAIIKEKYSLDQQANMSKEQLDKVQKMFLILSASGLTLLSEANSIKGSRLELDSEDYLSLKEIEDIHRDICMSCSLMCKPRKNYGVAVWLLVLAYKTICEAGNYTDEISVGLHGTISMGEL